MVQNTLLTVVSSSHTNDNTKNTPSVWILYYYHPGLSRKVLSIIYCKSKRTVDHLISKWEHVKVARLTANVNP